MTQKNNLFFNTISPDRKNKTGQNFFIRSKTKQNFLPILDSNKNQKLKTTSDNFYKNKKISIKNDNNDINNNIKSSKNILDFKRLMDLKN